MATHELQLKPSSSSSPQPLPSLPPSPTEEEDLGRPAAWANDEPHIHSLNSPTKGKSPKSRDSDDGNYEIVDEEEQEAQNGVAGYPPMTDEETESRRVEENLRRWEIAERERRRAARGSAQASSSTVGDVVKRASSLWSKRSSRIPKDGAGRHAVLRGRSSEDGVALSDINDASPSLSVANSPNPSIHDFSAESENPFANPVRTPISPFDDVHQTLAIMSSVPPTPAVENTEVTRELAPNRRASSGKPPPPPEPLGLPEPKAPPPRAGTPVANRAPEPISPLSPAPVPTQQEEEPPTRWWTDWLCGCSEGPDRGGDNQAGKTNPME
ncbi:hypothetical protein NEOLEDRAFT_208193 [Neolentinus lepideus HHB14362 ss-1]|uniref:Uncharacterized protein n=1 Tax=Neolentinus lepideus HHB14362 ss-1 TaxID=1314782 RepID=A0A165TJW6_9AGAM|nr:hypothetical protein NEOLEDRAFT_208193 [Neolentinus lepideus HHB14362 ss-1]